MARLHEVALDLGLKTGTLRSYLVALEALESINDPPTRKILRRHPSTAVAAFGRWFHRDPYDATAFIRANSSATLAEFLSAERISRQGDANRSRRRRAFAIDDLLKEATLGSNIAVELGVPAATRFADLPASGPAPQTYKFAGLNRLITASSSGHPHDPFAFELTGGVITVPKWQLLETYAQRASEIWQRSVSASTVCPLVLVILPGPAARRRLLGAFPLDGEAKTSSSNFGITGLPHAPQARIGSASRPIFYRAAPHLGLIVFTSLLTLLRDLTH